MKQHYRSLVVKAIVHDDTPDVCLAAHGKCGPLPHETGLGEPPCKCRHILETITVRPNGAIVTNWEEIGQPNHDDEEPDDCAVCDGLGTLICHSCSGTGSSSIGGKLNCYACNGKGEVPCEECQ